LHFLDLTLPTIEENLALDEALLIDVEEGRLSPLVRIWEMDRPAVVLGASGRWKDDVIVEACRLDDVLIARRASGGGTVVIGPGALNFTVILPRDFAPELEAVDRAQVFVLERLAERLRGLGTNVEVLGSGDLTVDRRKIGGSAQRRLKRHFLVHTSLLYRFPLEWITRYTRPPQRQPEYRERRLHEDFVANLSLSRNAIVRALQTAWDTEESFSGEIPGELINKLVSEKYGDLAWVERL
jgi:lipoate-protein ligase A